MHVSSHLGLIQGGYLIVYVSGPWADPLANPPGTCFTKRLREDRLALPLPPGVKFCSPFVMPLSSTMLRYDCSSPAQQPLGEKSDFSLGWHGLDILHLANPPGVKADPLADPLSHCQGVRQVADPPADPLMAWKGDSAWADPLANPPGACNSKQAFRLPYQGKETFFTQTLWGSYSPILGAYTTQNSAMHTHPWLT